MTLNMQKCQFSLAYLQVVTAVAGIKILRCDIDDDSIDAGLERSGGCAPKLDLQLKCTASVPRVDAAHRFDLSIKNYNDLRRATMAPRFLVVLYVPDLLDEWLDIGQDRAVLRYHARWLSLEGFPDVDNDETVGVQMPHENIFTPETVIELMNQVENEYEAV